MVQRMASDDYDKGGGMKVYMIWSYELACFVRFKDLTGCRIEPTLSSSVLSWLEPEPAEAAIRQVAELSGLSGLEVRTVDAEDGL